MARKKNRLTAKDLGEKRLLEIAGRMKLSNPDRVIRGIGDDCAVIRLADNDRLLITTDVMIDGVHFHKHLHPPALLGRKLLAISMSDIASMGGRSTEAVVSTMLTGDIEERWIEEFYSGLQQSASENNVNIVGGDTSQSPDRLAFSLTLLGVPGVHTILRSGAKPGDEIYVTGTLGDADAGLELLKRNEDSESYHKKLIDIYLDPDPDVRLGMDLGSHSGISAMTDLSDGLTMDLRNICQSSGVAALLNAENIPLSDELREFCLSYDLDPLTHALHAGGDYELLFTLNTTSDAVSYLNNHSGLSRIGEIIDGVTGRISIVSNEGILEEIEEGGWEHFKSG